VRPSAGREPHLLALVTGERHVQARPGMPLYESSRSIEWASRVDASVLPDYLLSVTEPDDPRRVQAPYAEADDTLTAVEPRSAGRTANREVAAAGRRAPMDAGPAAQTARAPETNLRLFEVIGRGGMGEVYRGEQVELGRPVAFKQLLEEKDEVLRERFVREARITAQLDHPNIVPVHVLEVSDRRGPLGYAMKLVEGKTLRALLQETADAYEAGRPIDEEHALSRRLEHFTKICDALAFAHARGILHRDLKPANFMIGKFGEVYVMDWGVARPMGAAGYDASGTRKRAIDPELTQLGDIIGSPAYMSPEQADGRNDELDGRADQYVLGLILFEIVSLQRAMSSTDVLELFDRASKGVKSPLRHVSKRVRIPAELRAIVAKATAFAPNDRYASVAALAEDVRRFMRGESVAAMRDGLFLKLWRVMLRNRRATLAALIGGLALAAITVSWSLYRKTASELAARKRGERITTLYADVSAQGHRIDGELQKMEEALEGLRTAAVWALTGPEPPAASAPFYFDTDFSDLGRRPKDFTSETKYRWPVSVEFPVVGVAPGTSRDALTPSLRRLSPLREHMRSMFVRAAGGDPSLMNAAELRDFLLQRRGPIDYAYVNLPAGVYYGFPGVDALPPDYDVRTAGFYTMSANKHGRRWGAPYVDSTTDELGDDLVLPCTEGLWSPGGEFLGVAGVEITVTKMVETSLSLPARATVRTSLLDAEGKKVIDSFDAGKRFKASGKDEASTLYEFDIPKVVDAVKAGNPGLLEVRRDGRDLIVAFVRLDVLGWFYVVEVEAKSVD
jgi:serine/threonine protein kinase